MYVLARHFEYHSRKKLKNTSLAIDNELPDNQ